MRMNYDGTDKYNRLKPAYLDFINSTSKAVLLFIIFDDSSFFFRRLLVTATSTKIHIGITHWYSVLILSPFVYPTPRTLRR